MNKVIKKANDSYPYYSLALGVQGFTYTDWCITMPSVCSKISWVLNVLYKLKNEISLLVNSVAHHHIIVCIIPYNL